jgi:glycosyltransferase involved in cell wall biosynthesis
MLPKLSIIIPCYNCASTLIEAVDSCFAQGLTEKDFEVVLVDDGSQDQTRNVMETLSKKYANLSLVFHEENRGGGAARNSGIKHSTGDILYCLDSDNLFAPHSVIPIIKHFEDSSVDGVAFYERRFFPGNNLSRYTTHRNTIFDRPITLEDLFVNDILLDNFFFSRTAYQRTAGYPEHHGFDTQCFEVRFLSSGNVVTVAPHSIFYHRHATGEPSYFERVHNAGLFSINMMLIFEEIFHLLTPAAQDTLLSFPIFTNAHSDGASILSTIKNLAKDGDFLIAESNAYSQPDGRHAWLTSTDSTHKDLVNCYELMGQSHYPAALASFTQWQATHTLHTPYVTFLYLRLGVLLSGCPKARHVTAAITAAATIKLQPIHARSAAVRRMLRQFALVQWIARLAKKSP